MRLRIGILLIVLLVLLSGCHQLKSSLREPVDPEDSTIVSFEVVEGDSWSSVSSRLSELKLVSTKGAVMDFVKEQSGDTTLSPGKFNLSKSMDLETIVTTLLSQPILETVTVTIPEGYEVRDIAKTLEEAGVIKQDDFLKTLETGDFSDYEFLKNVDQKKYLLEGYLFPDTYEFFKNSDGNTVVRKFLNRFQEIWTPELQARARELEMSTHHVITLSSIVEREARVKEEFPIISGVFQNRLKEGMNLEACSTVQFILKERKPVLSIADTQIESEFNTYIYQGLPPSPIASPGLNAIKAVLYPEETNYKFFVLENPEVGNHLFAETYEEHLENMEKSEGVPE